MIVIDTHKKLILDEGMKRAEADVIGSGKRDEFGVRPLNLYYNDAGRAFCLSDAPSTDAVRKSHDKIGLKCDEIVAVNCLADCR